MAWSSIKPIKFRGVRGGMNDSLYATEIAMNQASLIRNMHLSREGVASNRGGSVRVSDTALANKPLLLHQFVKHNTNGTITRTNLVATSAGLYQFNATTLVFDAIAGTGTPSGNKPCIVDFLNGSGVECIVYCDGTLFFMWDGTTVTSLLSGWTTAGFTSAPRYLAVFANALWAAGDTSRPSGLGFSDDFDPTVFSPTSYIQIEPGKGQILGLCPFYNNLAVAKNRSIHLITGKDISEFARKKVSADRGAFSHWGMVPLGHLLFFNDDANFYVGSLRAVEDDGMLVDKIGDNMGARFSKIAAGSASTMDSAYIPDVDEIFWTTRTSDANDFNEVYVFSTKHSHFDVTAPLFGADPRYVWSGVWTGLSTTAIAGFEDSNGKLALYCGTSDGYVMLLNDGFKDNRAVGATVGTDIVFEVQPAEVFLTSEAVAARVRRVFPVFYAKYNEAVTLEYIIDQAERGPADVDGNADPIKIKFTGNVPYWNVGTDPDITSQWGHGLWKDRPFLRAAETINVLAGSFQPIFRVPGTNAQEEFAFAGWAGTYQIKKARIRG